MHKLRNATRTTKIVVAAVAAIVVFACTFGFAASLGLTSSGLGAGSAVVASCGTGINAAYTTTYSASIPGYSVSQVNLSAIPAACQSKSYRIQLTGAGGAAVGAEMSRHAAGDRHGEHRHLGLARREPRHRRLGRHLVSKGSSYRRTASGARSRRPAPSGSGGESK